MEGLRRVVFVAAVALAGGSLVVDASVPVKGDPDLCRPGRGAWEAQALDAAGERNDEDADREGVESESDFSEDTDGDAAPETRRPQRIQGRPDYMERLYPRGPRPNVVGILEGILLTCAEIWEEDGEVLAAAVADHFRQWTPHCPTPAQTMAVEAQQRYLRGYLTVGSPARLPPYWSQWVEMAMTAVMDEAAFYHDVGAANNRSQETGTNPTGVEAANDRRPDYANADQGEHEDVVWMQMSSSSSSATSARPRRPETWNRALHRLRQLRPRVKEQAFRVLREWLTQRVNRIGHPYVVQAMMRRDCLGPEQLGRLTVEENAEANREARVVMDVVEGYLHNYMLYQDGASQDLLVNTANEVAAYYDEVNVDLAMVAADEADRRDFEEVQLQLRVNDMVRRCVSEVQGASRGPILAALRQALRFHVGSEARHLRRMCMALQGLIFLGEDTFPSDANRPEEEELIHQMLDNLVLMATEEMGPASAEQAWLLELNRLRRWLAEDRLVDEELLHPPEEDQEAESSDAAMQGDLVREQATEHANRSHEGEAVVEGLETQQDPDVSSLVQGRGKAGTGGLRRGREGGRGRSRSHERERPPSSRAAREQSQRDARTNAHRPWREARVNEEPGRSSCSERGRPRDSARESSSTARNAHPATIYTADGPVNMGFMRGTSFWTWLVRYRHPIQSNTGCPHTREQTSWPRWRECLCTRGCK